MKSNTSQSLKMNFNFLFSVVSALSFVVEFPVNSNNTQDYFFFEGNNQTAHLYRENKTLFLHLNHNHGKMFSFFNTTIKRGTFLFSWKGFKVDGVDMLLQRSNGDIQHSKFEHFTFVSPIINVLDIESPVTPVYNLENDVNYWYFFFLTFAAGILLESKTKGFSIFKQLVQSSNKNLYVTTEPDCNQGLGMEEGDSLTKI